jgi:excisionase family DNA binding protein
MTVPSTHADPSFLTVKQAAAILNVSEKVLRKALEDKLIPYVKLGERTVRIPADGLRDMWERRIVDETGEVQG